ncbi:hypothetical protein BMS17_07605 [Pseudomonas sp. C9]|nr:hypothetical protein BMS17_07605 [Pseudomonas sp. C9]
MTWRCLVSVVVRHAPHDLERPGLALDINDIFARYPMQDAGKIMPRVVLGVRAKTTALMGEWQVGFTGFLPAATGRTAQIDTTQIPVTGKLQYLVI